MRSGGPAATTSRRPGRVTCQPCRLVASPGRSSFSVPSNGDAVEPRQRAEQVQRRVATVLAPALTTWKSGSRTRQPWSGSHGGSTSSATPIRCTGFPSRARASAHAASGGVPVTGGDGRPWPLRRGSLPDARRFRLAASCSAYQPGTADALAARRGLHGVRGHAFQLQTVSTGAPMVVGGVVTEITMKISPVHSSMTRSVLRTPAHCGMFSRSRGSSSASAWTGPAPSCRSRSGSQAGR